MNLTLDQVKQKHNRWDKYFHDQCLVHAGMSRCLSRQIGAILVNGDTVVATGYNGPPRGISHCQGDKCPRQVAGFGSGEGLHLCPAAHAETNTIVNAARNGVSTLGTTMYMTCGIPCKECLKLIINAGIVEIVVSSITDWYDDLSKQLVAESKLRIRKFSHL